MEEFLRLVTGVVLLQDDGVAVFVAVIGVE
jgi:hypothetical protein